MSATMSDGAGRLPLPFFKSELSLAIFPKKKIPNTTYYEYKINSESSWPLGEQTDMGTNKRNSGQ